MCYSYLPSTLPSSQETSHILKREMVDGERGSDQINDDQLEVEMVEVPGHPKLRWDDVDK